jgi:NAD(P)-dependent dehydrogenase (short-subunit alcohol dehydrogenase family)
MATRTIAFVTGGNNGIGYEAVKALLQSSKTYHVFMGSRSLDRAATAIQKLKEECPETKNTVEAVQLDLTSDSSIEAAFNKISSSTGHLDALVNNAGQFILILSRMTLLTVSRRHI